MNENKRTAQELINLLFGNINGDVDKDEKQQKEINQGTFRAGNFPKGNFGGQKKPFETDEQTVKSYDGYRLEKVVVDGKKVGIKLLFCVPGLSANQIEIIEDNGFIKVKSIVDVPFFGKLDQTTKISEWFDLKNMIAKMKNGVLTIEIPANKEPVSIGRKIDIIE